MVPTEHHRSSSSSMAFIGRSVLSLRRNQVASMDQYHEDELQDLDLFQSYVADRLLSLSSSDPDQENNGTLSFSFLHNLLHLLLSCKDEFKNLLSRNPALFAKPPNDKLIADLLDRTVKSLDVFNLLTQNIHSLRHWNRHAEISAAAVINAPPGEGPLRRAKKALAKLLATSSEPNKEACKKTRSSLRQCKSSPRIAEAGCGLGLAVYTMASVLAFATWALVMAFPCPATFLSAAVPPPVGPTRQLAWSASLVGIQERIGEEVRKRGRREGLLVEYVEVERIGREMMELVENGTGIEVVTKATELAGASGRLEEGLGVFEREVREVFHRVVENRAEVMRLLEQNSKIAPPFIVL